MGDRPTQKYTVGQELRSAYHDEQGVVQKVEWTYTFGTWTYLLLRTQDSRYGGEKGSVVWVCEGDLKPTCSHCDLSASGEHHVRCPTRNNYTPIAFDTLEDAKARARTWEDRVDAVADYEETMRQLNGGTT